MDKTPAGLSDLLAARDLETLFDVIGRMEIDPIWGLALFGLVMLFFLRHLAAPIGERRDPRPGTFYLGNVDLGANRQVERPRRLNTRLRGEAEYEDEEPPARRR